MGKKGKTDVVGEEGVEKTQEDKILLRRGDNRG